MERTIKDSKHKISMMERTILDRCVCVYILCTNSQKVISKEEYWWWAMHNICGPVEVWTYTYRVCITKCSIQQATGRKDFQWMDEWISKGKATQYIVHHIIRMNHLKMKETEMSYNIYRTLSILWILHTTNFLLSFYCLIKDKITASSDKFNITHKLIKIIILYHSTN